MKYTISDYCGCAQNVFGQIKSMWSDYNNFWRIGNAFDTLIDYFVNVDPDDVSLAKQASDFFNGGKRGAWFDDFGWWGIAFLRAARYASLLHLDSTTCLNNATICWQKMDDNAPLVWEKADQQTFRAAKPRFVGGCWNNYFSACNPFTERLCGFQNTVTNGLYQVLAARSFQQWQASPYYDAAIREYSWLNQWFFHPDLTADKKLLFTDTSDRILARERVSIYDFYNGSYPKVGYYEPELHWAGDQGLILGAMVYLAPIVQREILYTVATGILEGVRSLLVNNQGILQPWIPAGESFQGDSPDYATGVGVYMRYLLYAFQKDRTLKPYIQQTYQQFLRTNADAICEQIDSRKCPELPDKTTIEPMECALNRLAVLTAAIVILSQ